MIRKVVFRPQADQEVQLARSWYEEQRPDLGAQFSDAIDQAVERITLADAEKMTFSARLSFAE